MTFDKVPDRTRWLAQDADGTWHPRRQSRLGGHAVSAASG